MKIAVSASGDSMDAEVSERFVSCEYFLVVDLETLGYETVPNPGVETPGSAGFKAARTLSEHGVKAVLTGEVEANAKHALTAAGIRIVSGISGRQRSRDVVEQYLNAKVAEKTTAV